MPYVVALFAMLFNGWHSDKGRKRRWHAAFPVFIAAVGFLCLISLPSSNLMTVLLLSVICMAMAFLPVFWAIPTEILSDSKAAVAVGTINALASFAGFDGPYSFGYLRAQTGAFVAGFALLMLCCARGRGPHATDTKRPVADFRIYCIDLMRSGVRYQRTRQYFLCIPVLPFCRVASSVLQWQI